MLTLFYISAMMSAAIYLSARQIAEDKTYSTILTGGVHSIVGIALSHIQEFKIIK